MNSSEYNFVRKAVETAMGQNESYNMFYSLSLTFPFLT
ncbi:unnamed protein product, partial [Allacma fusca]